MRTKTVSSGTLFKTLVDLGSKKSTTAGTKLDAKEVKAALDSFKWGDFKVTKMEVIAAKKEFAVLQKAGKLTQDGAQAVNDWFAATGAGEPGGFSYERPGAVVTQLESFLRWSPESDHGATLSKVETEAMLSVLGDEPNPGRIAQVQELKSRLKPGAARTAVTHWLTAHPMPAPAQPLLGKLNTVVKGMLWPSETDRRIVPMSLGRAPSARANVANAFRAAAGESSTSPVEVRSFDDTFAQLTEVDDPNDPDLVKRCASFAKLRDTLKANLTDLHVIRTGKIDIDVYVVGKDPAGNWVGVTSGVVET